MSARLRTILQAIHKAATDEAADVMTEPSWALDYSFPFTLTVRELREIHAYLHPKPTPRRAVKPLHCGSIRPRK